MSNLVILIPFSANPKSDLDKGAGDFQAVFNEISNHRLGENIGAEIRSIKIIHLASREICQHGDYVILFAHGSNEDTDLSNNKGATTTMGQAIKELKRIHAQNAERLLFMTCYSGFEGHIGTVWKEHHPQQKVFAGKVDISNLFSATRTMIKSVCLALVEI